MNVYEQRVMVRYVRRRSAEHFVKNNESFIDKVRVNPAFFVIIYVLMITVEQIKDILTGKLSYYDKEMRAMLRDGLPPYEITYKELLNYFKMFTNNTFGSMYGAQGTLILIQDLIHVSKLYKKANKELKVILERIMYSYAYYDFYDEEGREIYRLLYNYKKPYKEKLLVAKDHLEYAKSCINKGELDPQEKIDLKFAFNYLIEHKDPEGTYLLGNIYNRTGNYLGYRGNYESAEEYLKLAGSLGVVQGYLDVGFLYLHKLVKHKKSDVFAMFSSAFILNNKNIDAMIGLAICFNDGLGVEKNLEHAKDIIARAMDESNSQYEALRKINYHIALLAVKFFEYITVPNGHFGYKESRTVTRAIDALNNKETDEEELRERLYEIARKDPRQKQDDFLLNDKKDEYKNIFIKGDKVIIKDNLHRIFEGQIVNYKISKKDRYDNLETFVKIQVIDIKVDDEDHTLYKAIGPYYAQEIYLTFRLPQLQILNFFKEDGVFVNEKDIEGFIRIKGEDELNEFKDMLNGDRDKTIIDPQLGQNNGGYIELFINQNEKNRLIVVRLCDVVENQIELNFQNYSMNKFYADYIEKVIVYKGGYKRHRVLFKAMYYRIEEA